MSDSDINYETFEDIFSNNLTLKQKCIGADNSLFMTKPLRQDITHRTKLRNKFLKHPCGEHSITYKRQRSKCVKRLRNEEKQYYKNLNLKCLFWRTVKPFSKTRRLDV